MHALELADGVAGEMPDLNQVLRRTSSLQQAAENSRNPAAALAYLLAADRVIRVDEFPPRQT
jgi:acyl-CoA dehydrogenase